MPTHQQLKINRPGASPKDVTSIANHTYGSSLAINNPKKIVKPKKKKEIQEIQPFYDIVCVKQLNCIIMLLV